MSITTRLAIFGFVFVVLFVGAMASITGGVLDIAAAASVPVIVSAEAMVLGMIYMTTFHSEAHAEPKEIQSPKLDTYSHVKQRLQEQQKV